MESPLAISENLQKILSYLPEGVELVAVSKFQPVDAIKAAYDAGQRIFGESRVQELLEKIPLLPADISWHFIGHLQSNKVKALIGKPALIQSVDSEKLLGIINDESAKKDVVTNILLQVHVAKEETKFGFSPEELLRFVKEKHYCNLGNINICGLMAMATNTDDTERVRKDFEMVADLFREVSAEIKPVYPDFNTLSMGMSGDWPLAVEEGANLVRVGSAIFGSRY